MIEEFLDDNKEIVSLNNVNEIVEEGYVIGSEGVFLQEFTSIGKVRKRFSGKLYGLPKITPKFIFTLPKIPTQILDMVYSLFYDAVPNEVYVNVLWNTKKKTYRLDIPSQVVCTVSSEYEWPNYEKEDELVVVSAHSHNSMGAFFSGGDDKASESGFCQMVMGHIRTNPEVLIRYGKPNSDIILNLEEIFNINSDYKLKYVVRNWDCVSMVKEEVYSHNYGYYNNWNYDDYNEWNNNSYKKYNGVNAFNKLDQQYKLTDQKKTIEVKKVNKKLVSFKVVKKEE